MDFTRSFGSGQVFIWTCGVVFSVMPISVNAYTVMPISVNAYNVIPISVDAFNVMPNSVNAYSMMPISASLTWVHACEE